MLLIVPKGTNTPVRLNPLHIKSIYIDSETSGNPGATVIEMTDSTRYRVVEKAFEIEKKVADMLGLLDVEEDIEEIEGVD